MDRFIRIKSFLILLVFSGIMCSSFTYAGQLSIAESVELSIAMKQLTVNGMIQRYGLLKKNISNAVQGKNSDKTQLKIKELLENKRLSMTDFLRFQVKNKMAIDKWLSSHPDQQNRIEALSIQFDDYQERINRVIQSKNKNNKGDER